MSSQVYSVAINLSQLQKALNMSKTIRTNISGSSGTGAGSNKSSMLGNLNQSNKQLKEQNKQLSITEQKLKLIRLTASKLKLGALALGGLAVGGVIGSLTAMKGSLSADLQARNNRLTFGEGKALGYTDKMMGLNEGTLMSSISGLNKALDDFSQWGNFASLGLNASELKKKNPTEALFEVLDAMKTSDLPKYMKRNIIDQIGIPFDDFQFVLQEGTGELRKFFKQGMGLYGKESAKVLKSSERALINFQAALKKLSLSIANRILPAFTKALNIATPYILKFADWIGKFIGKVFTVENMRKLSDFISKIIKAGKDLYNYVKDFIQKITPPIVDAFKRIWSIMKPAVMDLGNSLKEFWDMMGPELIKFGKWFKKDILPLVIDGVGMTLKIMVKAIKNVVDAFNLFYRLIRPIMKPLGNLIKFLFIKFNEALKVVDNLNLDKLLVPLSAIGEVGKWWNSFKTAGSNVWQHVKDSFNNIWKGMKEGVKNIWTSIKEGFLVMITGLIDMINGILNNKVVSTLTGGASIKAGWGYDEQGNFGKRTYDSKGNYKVTKINDGVITKDGQVVKTSPQDYIFAMKQPQQLATAGASNYTININANVRNDSDVAKIKNELHRLITQLNAKR